MGNLRSPLANLEILDGRLKIEPRGIHRWASLSKGIDVPLENITKVRVVAEQQLADVFKPRLTKRKQGSQIGDRYRAGAFQFWNSDEKFWLLVKRGDRAVEISVADHRFDIVIVGVDDPEEVVRVIETAIDAKEGS